VPTILYVQLTLFAKIVNLETRTNSVELLLIVLLTGDYFRRVGRSGALSLQ